MSADPGIPRPRDHSLVDRQADRFIPKRLYGENCESSPSTVASGRSFEGDSAPYDGDHKAARRRLSGIAGVPCLPSKDSGPCGLKLSRRQSGEKQGFVLEIGGRPVLALAGRDVEHAKALCSQPWFLEDLRTYRSCGNPIWDGGAKFTLRHASAREAAELEVALQGERARGEYEGYVFVFLVPVDSVLQ
jgi:hypothetical protein